MEFTSKEKSIIYNNQIFIKKIKNKEYYVKPFFKYENIIERDFISLYKNYLLKYIKNHLPKLKFIKYPIPKDNLFDTWYDKTRKRKSLTLFVQEKIKGNTVKNISEFKKLIDLPVNKELKAGMRKLLKKENAVLLLYPSKEYNYKNNFIVNKNKKIFYIDSRNPVVFEDKGKNEKITKQLIK